MIKQTKQSLTLKIKSRKLQGEIWELAYPGYALSNKGRWYSFSREKIMRQHPNSSGYKRVTLLLETGRKHILTHIKVVEIFGDCKGNKIPEGATSLREIGLSIDHLDSNRKNPSQENLELVTHVENCLRRSKNKLINAK